MGVEELFEFSQAGGLSLHFSLIYKMTTTAAFITYPPRAIQKHNLSGTAFCLPSSLLVAFHAGHLSAACFEVV